VDLAWLAPPAVLLVGSAVAAGLLRSIARSLQEVDAGRRRVRRLDDALIPLRVETRRTRESLDRFDHR
jgi:hypothetical protein